LDTQHEREATGFVKNSFSATCWKTAARKTEEKKMHLKERDRR
jgi:hypothetical protein